MNFAGHRQDVVLDLRELAVRQDFPLQGDELVGHVMKSLAETFSNELATLEGQLNQTDKASTETLRIALQRYRSFFERLLSF